MIDPRLVREDPASVRHGLARRGEDPGIVDRWLELDAERRGMLAEIEGLRAERNQGSKAVAGIQDAAERAGAIAAMRQVADRIKGLEQAMDGCPRR
jgi:seryl-tRNA synthetase